MGDDDANVGFNAGECPGHVWQFEGVSLVPGQGATTDYSCARGCGAVTVVGPGQPMPG